MRVQQMGYFSDYGMFFLAVRFENCGFHPFLSHAIALLLGTQITQYLSLFLMNYSALRLTAIVVLQ